VKSKQYLDIGCGTGNYTIALTDKGFKFYGIDPSDEMLGAARSRTTDVQWLYGKAEAIPMDDNSCDGAIATLTIHHWEDIGKGFSELARVLRPGSKLVLFTATPEQMETYWLNYYFPEMLRVSASKMPTFEAIRALAEQAGLEIKTTEKYFVHHLQDHFLYVGKDNPELYFDERIREGISSFAAFSAIDEVNAGLTQLRSDIESGIFNEIKQRYEDGAGDYLFIALEKGKV
jgi:SAM-dependent methyltransferase